MDVRTDRQKWQMGKFRSASRDLRIEFHVDADRLRLHCLSSSPSSAATAAGGELLCEPPVVGAILLCPRAARLM